MRHAVLDAVVHLIAVSSQAAAITSQPNLSLSLDQAEVDSKPRPEQNSVWVRRLDSTPSTANEERMFDTSKSALLQKVPEGIQAAWFASREAIQSAKLEAAKEAFQIANQWKVRGPNDALKWSSLEGATGKNDHQLTPSDSNTHMKTPDTINTHAISDYNSIPTMVDHQSMSLLDHQSMPSLDDYNLMPSMTLYAPSIHTVPELTVFNSMPSQSDDHLMNLMKNDHSMPTATPYTIGTQTAPVSKDGAGIGQYSYYLTPSDHASAISAASHQRLSNESQTRKMLLRPTSSAETNSSARSHKKHKKDDTLSTPTKHSKYLSIGGGKHPKVAYRQDVRMSQTDLFDHQKIVDIRSAYIDNLRENDDLTEPSFVEMKIMLGIVNWAEKSNPTNQRTVKQLHAFAARETKKDLEKTHVSKKANYLKDSVEEDLLRQKFEKMLNMYASFYKFCHRNPKICASKSSRSPLQRAMMSASTNAKSHATQTSLVNEGDLVVI